MVINMVEIINLGHACFLIKNNDKAIVVDPYKNNSVPNLNMPYVKANYICCSHNHDDHCGVENVELIPIDERLEVQKLLVPHDHENGRKRGLNVIHIFNIENFKIIHLGDTGCIPNPMILERLKNADVVLGPINGFFTISAQEFVEIVKKIEPRIYIPMHYYIKENNSGYPDGGQIDKLKELVPNYKEVNDYKICLDSKYDLNGLIILKKALQYGEQI